jgi:predicted outer membrane repeat protein
MTAIMVVLVLGAMSTAACGGANHWYVDPDGNDLSDGNSWDEAFATIQKGIDKADKGDLVKVKAGTYYETINFKGKAITLRGTDPNSWLVVAATIIDAKGSGNVVTFDSNEDGNSVLEGFTIRNGDRGIYCKKTSPTIELCIITRNHSRRDGGGMYNLKASPMVANCIFSRNSSASNGGGMYNRYSPACPDVISCVFTGNSSGDEGGGMANWAGASPTVINCVFYRNTASDRGGGMVNKESKATMVNCTFFDNSAKGGGGGICNKDDPAPELYNCILWGNDAGEIYNRRCKPLFSYCDIEGGLNGDKCGGDDSKGRRNDNDDPKFVNSSDPNGADDTWGTSDDGLIPTEEDVVDEGDDKIVKDRRITTDIKGDDRIIGKRVDMGAYEYKYKPRPRYKRKPRPKRRPRT